MPERRRTYGWSDPALLTEAAGDMSGLDFLRAIAERRLPRPTIQETLDYDLVEVAEGRVAFRGAPAEYMYNPLGTVHGAYYCALLDSALGCAIHSTLPQGWRYTTLDYKVNMVRALTAATGPVTATAEVLHRGRRIATADARLIDQDGKLYGHGTTTCMLLGPEP